ncbi:ribosomal 40S subunit protein S11A [Penicillium malachiteum]|uniref:ribosomal 40S subunit protein S11A n=1 Tax=Penicillium malachiteum TaxID=1324776 RepID=UPI0025491A55|nr:ribosomal 40S subunit protein S11A [Penicillium malachiteum]KAJ5735390.1 ribosomal 40S subunit protein S11A [Penicillium malachiteum]
MATELNVQSERAFQKQPHIFLNSKSKAKSKKAGQTRRWYKEVGLGFRTPPDRHRGQLHRYARLANSTPGRYLRRFLVFYSRKGMGNTDRLKGGTGIKKFRETVDKKCPFTGLVSIRGRILTGRVVSTKMHRTIVIRREYLKFTPKYNRYEKRHKNLAAHVSPAFRVEEGDWVTVGQCRPLSKTVRFNVLRVLPRTGKAVKSFSKF